MPRPLLHIPKQQSLEHSGGSPVKCHQEVQDPGAGGVAMAETWECSGHPGEGLVTFFCHLQYPVWPCREGGACPGHRGRTGGDALGKFLLDIMAKQIHPVTVRTLEWASQRGCWLSILGVVQNLGRQALSNLIYLALLEHGLFPRQFILYYAILYYIILFSKSTAVSCNRFLLLSADRALQ